MNPRALFLSTLFTLGGCFSPNTTDEMDTTDTDGDTDATTTDATTTTGTSMTTMADASATDTTTTTTTAGPTDDGPSTETNGNPVCGDGNLDPGEECDEGVNNALGNTCHPDCTLNVCGDGDVGPEETCDEGNDNALEIGACAPDCSKVIDVKRVYRYPVSPYQGTVVAPLSDGDLGADPISALDAACGDGYKALFAVAGEREAASGAYEPDPLDWVLQPYTAYVTANDAIVWITDSAPLLGVRDGEPMPLENPVAPTSLFFGIITGLNQDWTTAVNGTCDGWTSDSAGLSAATGDGSSTEDYLRGASTIECDSWNYPCPIMGSMFNCGLVGIYCVEQ